MSTTKRVAVMLSDEAIEALGKLTTPRKQGEFLSKLVMGALEGKTQQVGQPGILERIESRLERIEQKVGA